MKKPKIDCIEWGAKKIPCLIVNNRYQIYLDDGCVYDTIHARDIPQYVFAIRDKEMQRKGDNNDR